MFARAFLVAGFLILIAAFVGLGFWQLDRAEQKRTMFGAFDAGGVAATALPEGNVLAEQRYQRQFSKFYRHKSSQRL